MRICTTNPGKIREFGGLLAPLGIRLRVSDPGIDIPEPYNDFVLNALEKARGYHRHYKDEYLIVEDSGLVIPTLDNLPGPHSAHFADLDVDTLKVNHSGRPRSEIDPANNARVLKMMEGVPFDKRGAYFVCVIVVVDPKGGVAFTVARRVNGWITTEPRGEGGFGYDPVFESESTYGKTWAEIDDARKTLISHRTLASYDFLAWVCQQGGEVQ